MQGWLRFVGLLAEASSKDAACDLGWPLWTTTVGVTAEQLVGYHVDVEISRIIADSNLRIFRQRSLGTPFRDYVPLLANAERMVSAVLSPLLPVIRALGASSWLESFNSAEVQAEQLRRTEVDYCEGLLRGLHQRLDNGDTSPSILGDLLRYNQLTPKEELMFATTLTGSGMAAGTILVWLTGKLAASPEMQEKAFDAITAVYGDRVPDPLDTDRVEYIKALGLEASRFWTTIRSGFPRETVEDVVIDGFLIPKGTLVIYNSFQINRDPVRYDFPDEFVPERWINGHDGRTDQLGWTGPKIGVPHLTHGAGRRMCLGIPSTCAIKIGAHDSGR